MKIRFIRETDERVHGAAYEEGDVVDLSYPSAMRWLRRRLAVEVVPEPEGLRMRGRPMMGGDVLSEGVAEPEVQKPIEQESEPEQEPESELKPKTRRGRPRKRA